MRTFWIILIIIVICVLAWIFWPDGDGELNPEVEEGTNRALEVLDNSLLVTGGEIALAGKLEPDPSNTETTKMTLKGTVSKLPTAAPDPGGISGTLAPKKSDELTAEQRKKYAGLIVSGISTALMGTNKDIKLTGEVQSTPGPGNENKKQVSLNGSFGEYDTNIAPTENEGTIDSKELGEMADLIVAGIGSRSFIGAGGPVTIEGTIEDVPGPGNVKQITLNGSIIKVSNSEAPESEQPVTGSGNGTIGDLAVAGIGSRSFIGAGGGIQLNGTIKPDPSDSTKQILSINGTLLDGTPATSDPDTERLGGMIIEKLDELSVISGGKISLVGTMDVDPSDNSIQKIILKGTIEILEKKPNE